MARNASNYERYNRAVNDALNEAKKEVEEDFGEDMYEKWGSELRKSKKKITLQVHKNTSKKWTSEEIKKLILEDVFKRLSQEDAFELYNEVVFNTTGSTAADEFLAEDDYGDINYVKKAEEKAMAKFAKRFETKNSHTKAPKIKKSTKKMERLKGDIVAKTGKATSEHTPVTASKTTAMDAALEKRQSEVKAQHSHDKRMKKKRARAEEYLDMKYSNPLKTKEQLARHKRITKRRAKKSSRGESKLTKLVKEMSTPKMKKPKKKKRNLNEFAKYGGGRAEVFPPTDDEATESEEEAPKKRARKEVVAFSTGKGGKKAIVAFYGKKKTRKPRKPRTEEQLLKMKLKTYETLRRNAENKRIIKEENSTPEMKAYMKALRKRMRAAKQSKMMYADKREHAEKKVLGIKFELPEKLKTRKGATKTPRKKRAVKKAVKKRSVKVVPEAPRKKRQSIIVAPEPESEGELEIKFA